MGKQDLRARSISELRAMAKKSGIASKSDWRKEDFIKALSKEKTSAAKPAKSARKTGEPISKTPEKKKTLEKRTVAKPSLKPAVKAKQATQKALEQLTVAELRLLAKEKNVAVKKEYKKVDIIKAIKKAEGRAEKKPQQKRARKPLSARKKGELPEVSALTPALRRGRLPGPGVPTPEPLPLPPEYKEDKIVSMPVTPKRVYVYWEVTEETVSKYRGSLNLKVTDIKTGEFFYMPIAERIGEHFISVSPDSEYAIEIGVIDNKGEFVNMVQLQQAEPSVPESAAEVKKTAEPTGKTGLPEEFFEMPESISSH